MTAPEVSQARRSTKEWCSPRSVLLLQDSVALHKTSVLPTKISDFGVSREEDRGRDLHGVLRYWPDRWTTPEVSHPRPALRRQGACNSFSHVCLSVCFVYLFVCLFVSLCCVCLLACFFCCLLIVCTDSSSIAQWVSRWLWWVRVCRSAQWKCACTFFCGYFLSDSLIADTSYVCLL